MSRLEIEVKLRFGSPEEARKAIVAAGGVEKRSRHFEENRIYDASDGCLVRRQALLRLRATSDGQAWLTFKERVESSVHAKVREETEVSVASAVPLAAILEKLGFVTIYRYEKYRTVFEMSGAIVDLDETPMGCFVEIEAAEGRLEEVVSALGADPAEAITGDYRSLYKSWLEERGLPLEDMVFSGGSGRR